MAISVQTDRLNIRLDPALKISAEKIFAQIGISAADAVRMFLRQVEMQQGLPFEVKIPNVETRAAMHAAENGEGTRSSLREFQAELQSLKSDAS